MKGISIREFAKREGCSHTLVARAVKEGHLRRDADGTLDPGLVGSGWRPGNRRKIVEETPEEGAARAVAEAVSIPNIAKSEAEKEYYLAQLRRLEFEQKSGQVSPNADQVAIVSAAMSRVRTRLLAIPAEASPAVHRCNSVAEVEAELRRRVTEALEELSHGGGD